MMSKKMKYVARRTREMMSLVGSVCDPANDDKRRLIKNWESRCSQINRLKL